MNARGQDLRPVLPKASAGGEATYYRASVKLRMTGCAVALSLLTGTSLLASPPADASSVPHFIVHKHRETSGRFAGEMRYDVQSSRHWAGDRVWLQVWIPSERACNPGATWTYSARWVTILKKTADRHGRVSFWIEPQDSCDLKAKERFWSPPAPGYAVEKSAVFHPKF